MKLTIQHVPITKAREQLHAIVASTLNGQITAITSRDHITAIMVPPMFWDEMSAILDALRVYHLGKDSMK